MPHSDFIEQNRALNTKEIREGKTILASKPLQINVELTGICNIVPPCVFCSGKNFGHNYPHLDWKHLEQYSEFLERCQQINEDSFGEPLGHPRLVDLAREVIARGQRFSFVTNGLLLDRRRSDALAELGPLLGFHISFNATTADTYFKLHGKKIDRLIANVRYFVGRYKQVSGGLRPDVTLTFIVMRVNRHEVPDFLRLARELDIHALLAPLHDRPSVPLGKFGYDFVYENEMLSPEEYRRIGEEARQLAMEIGLQ